MANVDTVKSIITNMENILTGLGLNLEDISSDPYAESIYSCQLFYQGEIFGEPFGEKNKYNEIKFLIKIESNKSTPALSRTTAGVLITNLRSNITITNLNVVDLSSSLLVSKVIHPSNDEINYTPPITHIDYPLLVRYREI